jgi:FixJ family two-component response regulator
MRNDPIVYIVGADTAASDAMKRLVESVAIEARCCDPVELFSSVVDDRPGCVVLDTPEAGVEGLRIQVELSRRQIKLPVVVVTAHPEVATAVSAIKNGALDYFEKPVDDQVLLERIQAAIRHHARLQQQREDRDEIRRRMERLTPREGEVLEYVVAGLPSRKIADCLQLSSKTVEVHRAHLMHKTGAHGVADLVRMVLSVRGDDDGEAILASPSGR